MAQKVRRATRAVAGAPKKGWKASTIKGRVTAKKPTYRKSEKKSMSTHNWAAFGNSVGESVTRAGRERDLERYRSKEKVTKGDTAMHMFWDNRAAHREQAFQKSVSHHNDAVKKIQNNALQRSINRAGIKGTAYHTAILSRPAVRHRGGKKSRVKFK